MAGVSMSAYCWEEIGPVQSWHNSGSWKVTGGLELKVLYHSLWTTKVLESLTKYVISQTDAKNTGFEFSILKKSGDQAHI
jgi:hypothetical protein